MIQIIIKFVILQQEMRKKKLVASHALKLKKEMLLLVFTRDYNNINRFLKKNTFCKKTHREKERCLFNYIKKPYKKKRM